MADLFNDILTTESDLRAFLGQNNWNCSPGLPAMIIQSYLVFCQKMEIDFFESFHGLKNADNTQKIIVFEEDSDRETLDDEAEDLLEFIEEDNVQQGKG